MLNALKAICSVTLCILNLKGKNSAKFRTSCGIRQGAPLSSTLFILFMNDLIDYVRDRCVAEPWIETMHVLLHADDTLIITTKRSLFIQKCNIMLEYFCKNKIKLNIRKSGYITINGKPTDLKTPIDLNNGTLKYKNQITYLGVIFSDTSRINNDIKLFIRENRFNITIKFSNFCAKNYLAPLKIKLEVLNSCIASSLCYSCESWGKWLPNEIEAIFRIGIKTALSIRFSTPNEIVYIESGMQPLLCTIKKRQLKFWRSLNQNIASHSHLEKLLLKAHEIELPYVTYYRNLSEKYDSPVNCEIYLKAATMNEMYQGIRAADTVDIDSKLGTYFQINLELKTPTYECNTFEIERINITRFRIGSNNLLIETGRFATPRIPRENRMCLCGTEVQTLRHCSKK